MRRLHLEDREFVALKAVAFFDPSNFYFSLNFISLLKWQKI